jgi:hypothetical protein
MAFRVRGGGRRPRRNWRRIELTLNSLVGWTDHHDHEPEA